MNFVPYVPFDILRADNGIISNSDKSKINEFWFKVNKKAEGLSDAVGCYIFSIRAGKGVLPWYVGLAKRQPFHKECFTSHKINRYNEAIAGRKGMPTLTLIPKMTSTGRFARLSEGGHNDITFLEKMLIGTCLRRNPNLLNIRDTKLLREMVVAGLLNNPQGRDPSSVRRFKELLGI